MRLEFAVLLEVLEQKAGAVENDDLNQLIAIAKERSISLEASNEQKKQSITPKRTKQKDPNGPKRPTNAYLIFCDLEKEKIKKELESKTPGVTSDLSKALTEAWKSLDGEGRKPYYSLYEEDKGRYQRELDAYQKRQADVEPSHKRIKLTHEANDSMGPKPRIEWMLLSI